MMRATAMCMAAAMLAGAADAFAFVAPGAAGAPAVWGRRGTRGGRRGSCLLLLFAPRRCCASALLAFFFGWDADVMENRARLAALRDLSGPTQLAEQCCVGWRKQQGRRGSLVAALASAHGG